MVTKISNTTPVFQTPIENLPSEMILKIMQFLDIQSLSALSKTCRRFYSLVHIDCESLWKILYLRDLSFSLPSSTYSFYQLYKDHIVTQMNWENGEFTPFFKADLSDQFKIYDIEKISKTYIVCNGNDLEGARESGYSNCECYLDISCEDQSQIHAYRFSGFDLGTGYLNHPTVVIGHATCGLGFATRAWNRETGQVLWNSSASPPHLYHDYVIGVEHDAETYGGFNSVSVRDVQTGNVIKLFEENNLNHWSLSLDNHRLFCLSKEGDGVIWNLETLNLAYRLKKDVFGHLIVLINYDHHHFFCGNQAGEFFLVDKTSGEKGQEFESIPDVTQNKFNSIHIDDEAVIVNHDQGLSVWDRKSRTLNFRTVRPNTKFYQFHEKSMIIIENNQIVYQVNKSTGEEIFLFNLESSSFYRRRIKVNRYALFSHNLETETLRIWSLRKRSLLKELSNIQSFQSDDTLLAIVTNEAKLFLYDYSCSITKQYQELDDPN